MRQLLKVRTTLSQMVICNQWGEWKASYLERALKVKVMVLDEHWWARVQFVLDFTNPIMTMLSFADANASCFVDAYDGMDTMLENVKLFIQAHETNPTECEALCNKVEAIIHYHWEKMTTPLHLLAYALSPRYYNKDILAMPDRVAPYVDEEVATKCYTTFARPFPDDEMHKKVRLEFVLFALGSKLTPYAIKDQNDMGAITWCYMYGQPFQESQPLAINILSQVASSSAAEWNWSTYSYIHSMKRNWLGSNKLEDLVYIHTNLRLLSHKEDGCEEQSIKLWDVAPECANLDATLHDLTMMTNDVNNIMARASSTTRTMFGSNELASIAAEGDDENVDFFRILMILID